ncbi:MAG: cold shock domain-containing protein [Pseudomonadota bacterium]
MPRLNGTVKWFDATKGFGFVVSCDECPDVLLHANVLYDFGVSSVLEGSRITCEVVHTERGVQVSEIFSLEPPVSDPVSVLAQILPGVTDVTALLDAADLMPARVKWFDRGKGFGFVNVFGRKEDIFVHVEVMRAFGFAELERGSAICVKFTEGPRGLVAIALQHWDDAA